MAWASLGLGFAGSNQKGLLRMTQQMGLLLGLQQDILRPGTHLGWLASLVYPPVSTSDWLLEPQFPPRDAQPNVVLLMVSRRIRLGPHSSAKSNQSSGLLHTILMQLMVPLEIDSHQALMDLSNPLFSLIIPPLGRY